MLDKKLLAAALFSASALLSHNVFATNIDIMPSQVPNDGEEQPRTVNTAPTGFGPDAWQGPATGKSNWHARYLADGDYLSALFPGAAATLTISDIASISYWTNRPTGTPAGRDWWVQIYTRPDGTDDAASWYGYRFINNYNDHTATDAWTQYSTGSGMTFNRNDSLAGGLSGSELTLGDLAGTYGNELVEMISVQTDSGWNGFDGYMDGLEITLANGTVGRVNFTGEVPEPATMALFGAGLVGLFGAGRRRTRVS
jgi:hypothetical protein